MGALSELSKRRHPHYVEVFASSIQIRSLPIGYTDNILLIDNFTYMYIHIHVILYDMV